MRPNDSVNMDDLWNDDDDLSWQEMYNDVAHRAAKRDIERESQTEMKSEDHSVNLESFGAFQANKEQNLTPEQVKAKRRAQRFNGQG